MVSTSERKESHTAAVISASEVSLEIRHALTGLEHGEITIKVHDGRVVLIERITRLRPRRLNVLTASDR